MSLMVQRARNLIFIGCLALSLLLDSVMTTRSLSAFSSSSISFATSVVYESVIARKHESSRSDAQSYRSPLEEFGLPQHNATALPGPLGVVEQYIAWHGQEALERQPDNRRFIVAYYQCPVSVGNWLHYFTSHFYWGILTNRTILWKYIDEETCHHIRDAHQYHFNIQRCNVTSTKQELCDSLLSRAPWIASYDAWKDRLNLPETFHIPRVYTQWFLDYKRKRLRYKIETANYVDIIFNEKLVVDVHPWAFLRMDYFYWMPDLVSTQLGTRYARATVKALGEWGSQFLFGLLWRYSFDFTLPIRKEVLDNPTVQASHHSHVFSVALHSRHITSDDNGCNVTLEQNAMTELLQQHRNRTKRLQHAEVPCQVTLLSDRMCTVDSMKEWLDQDLGCSSVMAQHSTVDSAFKEHGPFSGAGFFKDMLTAGLTVRDGMVGSLEPLDGNRWRSSSELIEEAVAYYRVMHYFTAGKNPASLPEMLTSSIVRDEEKGRRNGKKLTMLKSTTDTIRKPSSTQKREKVTGPTAVKPLGKIKSVPLTKSIPEERGNRVQPPPKRIAPGAPAMSDPLKKKGISPGAGKQPNRPLKDPKARGIPSQERRTQPHLPQVKKLPNSMLRDDGSGDDYSEDENDDSVDDGDDASPDDGDDDGTR